MCGRLYLGWAGAVNTRGWAVRRSPVETCYNLLGGAFLPRLYWEQHKLEDGEMAETRTANSVWEGDLTSGGGRVTAATSGAFDGMAVTQPTRFGGSEGNTSPEELIAAAHASCYSMALSAGLTRAGTPPGKLDVSASVTLDFVDGAPTVVSSALTVVGSVDGVSEAMTSWRRLRPRRTAALSHARWSATWSLAWRRLWRSGACVTRHPNLPPSRGKGLHRGLALLTALRGCC